MDHHLDALGVLDSAVEQVEPAVATILGRSVEFCISYLERSAFHGSDLGLQVCVSGFKLERFIGRSSFPLN